MVKGKKIVLGICGSIAAYKSAALIRLLIKEGAEVQVVATDDASAFIGDLTLATLSKKEVLRCFEREGGLWNNHVELGLWADHLLIAPVTANTIAKMANGLCDNLLLAVYLSARCPVSIAPAMDRDMWLHPSTKNNISILRRNGVNLIDVNNGELASGLIGEGRMAEPEEIMNHLNECFKSKDTLAGKRIVVTGGPTYEPIDPVRFIGNRSTGKMGVALARKAREKGAQVTLILGPSSLVAEDDGIEVVRVKTAEEMLQASLQHFEHCDWLIKAAAVSDYRCVEIASQKIKKKQDKLTLELEKNPDILLQLGSVKKGHQLLIGFALETNNEIQHAETKLHKKKLDAIVLNSLRDKGAGFGTDTNKIVILDKTGAKKQFELKSKEEVADDILTYCLQLERA